MRRRRKKTDFYKYLFLIGKKESEVTQSCQTVWDPLDCSLPGSSVHGILQARILEWVAIPFSRGSSRPRDRTQVSCIAGRCSTLWATREARVPQRKLISNWNPNSNTFSQAQLNTSSICTRKEMQFKSSLLSYTQRWVLPLLLTPIIQKTQPSAPHSATLLQHSYAHTASESPKGKPWTASKELFSFPHSVFRE